MKLYLAREEEKRNGLILKFSIIGARFNFMVCNPYHILELPRRLSWWINIIPGRVWDFSPDYMHYWGHIISFFYVIDIPLRKNHD